VATGEEKKESGGLSLQTLLISAVSAVVATVIVSQFWEKGTLLFTAMVPVMVALISEALKRPAERVAAVAPIITSARRVPGPTGTAVHDPAQPDVPEEARRTLPADDPFGLYERPRRQIDSGRWIRVGLVTGIVAFFVGAAVVTASELAIFGGSIGSGDSRTTYFGGSSGSSAEDEEDSATEDRPAEADPAEPAEPVDPAPTATPAPPEEEATPAPTQTPAATPTPEATATPEPAPEATPAPGETPAPAP